MSSVASTILSSPTFTSTSTASSYDLASEPRSRSSTISAQSFSLVDDSSDDEIVWDISSDHYSSDDPSTESSLGSDEEDFVVLSRPRSPPDQSGLSTPSAAPLRPLPSAGISQIASDLAQISLKPSPKPAKSAKKASLHQKKRSSETDVGSSLSSPVKSSKKPSSRRKRRAKKQAQASGLGARPIVDDVSVDGLSTDREDESSESSVYEEAVRYVTSFLRNPSAYYESSQCRLTLLQSIIIELGLVADSSLPVSLKSARAVLKSQVFLNIREYLAVRDQGLDAVKQVMYPTRSALIRSIRKQPRKRADLDWVKEHGLQVLLVSAFHH